MCQHLYECSDETIIEEQGVMGYNNKVLKLERERETDRQTDRYTMHSCMLGV